MNYTRFQVRRKGGGKVFSHRISFPENSTRHAAGFSFSGVFGGMWDRGRPACIRKGKKRVEFPFFIVK